ncbi:MAG: response regulator [bacterium]|nr:response regulator [bacterium]
MTKLNTQDNHAQDGPLILMVDDFNVNLQILKAILLEQGYLPASAQSGAEALKFLKSRTPDLILLDIMMPEMDGIEVCRRLKENTKTRDIPVIFITALTDVEDKVKAFEAGGVDYITRPFVKEEVLARVNVELSRKFAEDRLKTSLLEKELLLREIHHRVKNNMQVISSLLNLQAARLNDEEDRQLFADCQTRIRSMGIVHEKLYRSDSLSEIDFNSYVTHLVEELSVAYSRSAAKANVVLDVKNVFLNINQAVPCALLINELISNALKYAFPGESEGEIQIRFIKNETGTYCLSVSDNGVGLSRDYDIDKSDTLGLQLVRALTRQLRGEIKIDGENGTTITITFPPAAPPRGVG